MNVVHRLIALGFMPGEDFTARDDTDGRGPYIEAWLSSRPRPSEADLAGVVAPAAPTPEAISDRQFAQVLALDGVISEDEALAWAARGDLPAALVAAVDQIPDEDGARFSARMLLAAATAYERAHPLVPVLGALLGRDAAALDDIWRRGAML